MKIVFDHLTSVDWKTSDNMDEIFIPIKFEFLSKDSIIYARSVITSITKGTGRSSFVHYNNKAYLCNKNKRVISPDKPITISRSNSSSLYWLKIILEHIGDDEVNYSINGGIEFKIFDEYAFVPFDISFRPIVSQGTKRIKIIGNNLFSKPQYLYLINFSLIVFFTFVVTYWLNRQDAGQGIVLGNLDNILAFLIAFFGLNLSLILNLFKNFRSFSNFFDFPFFYMPYSTFKVINSYITFVILLCGTFVFINLIVNHNNNQVYISELPKRCKCVYFDDLQNMTMNLNFINGRSYVEMGKLKNIKIVYDTSYTAPFYIGEFPKLSYIESVELIFTNKTLSPDFKHISIISQDQTFMGTLDFFSFEDDIATFSGDPDIFNDFVINWELNFKKINDDTLMYLSERYLDRKSVNQILRKIIAIDDSKFSNITEPEKLANELEKWFEEQEFSNLFTQQKVDPGSIYDIFKEHFDIIVSEFKTHGDTHRYDDGNLLFKRSPNLEIIRLFKVVFITRVLSQGSSLDIQMFDMVRAFYSKNLVAPFRGPMNVNYCRVFLRTFLNFYRYVYPNEEVLDFMFSKMDNTGREFYLIFLKELSFDLHDFEKSFKPFFDMRSTVFISNDRYCDFRNIYLQSMDPEVKNYANDCMTSIKSAGSFTSQTCP